MHSAALMTANTTSMRSRLRSPSIAQSPLLERTIPRPILVIRCCLPTDHDTLMNDPPQQGNLPRSSQGELSRAFRDMIPSNPAAGAQRHAVSAPSGPALRVENTCLCCAATGKRSGPSPCDLRVQQRLRAPGPRECVQHSLRSGDVAFDWTPIGPRPTTGGQVEGIADEEVVGAINAVAAHPTNPDIVSWARSTAESGGPGTPGTRGRPGAAHRCPAVAVDRRSGVRSDGQHVQDPRCRDRPLQQPAPHGRSAHRVVPHHRRGSTWTTLDNGGKFGAVHIRDVAPRGRTHCGHCRHYRQQGRRLPRPMQAALGRRFPARRTGLPTGDSFALAGDPKEPLFLFAHIGTAGIFEPPTPGAHGAR